MIDDIINGVLAIAALFGCILMFTASSDSKVGRKREYLGFEFLAGSDFLLLVYNVAHSFKMGNEASLMFNTISLIMMSIGLLLANRNAMNDPKKLKSVMIGFTLICAVMTVQLLSELFAL